MDAAKVDQVVQGSLTKSVQYLAGWVKDRRLSGPRLTYLGVVTGRLRSSITGFPVIKTGDGYRATIGTNVVYGRIHEMGGRTGRGYAVKMPARPFLRPAIEDRVNIQGVVDDLTRTINRVLAG